MPMVPLGSSTKAMIDEALGGYCILKLNDSSKALIIVTGAPGSGKSTTVDHMLEQGTSFLVFDIDWLAQAAGDLAKKSIYSDPGTWGPYDALWRDVLRSIYRNSRQAIFFTPNTPDDIKIEPPWCSGINIKRILSPGSQVLDGERQVSIMNIKFHQQLSFG